MLLRNDSRVRHSIDIRLVFDDGLARELTIQEGDYVKVSYRKNGYVNAGVGVIKLIKPYAFTKKWTCAKESATIVVDMSTDLQANVESFDMFDIIDMQKVLPIDCPRCCCPICANTEDPSTDTPVAPEIEEEGSEISE